MPLHEGLKRICAAIGVAQLERVDQFLADKARVAARYRSNLADLPLTFQGEPEGGLHSHWMVALLVPDATQRDPLRAALDAAGSGWAGPRPYGLGPGGSAAQTWRPRNARNSACTSAPAGASTLAPNTPGWRIIASIGLRPL